MDNCPKCGAPLISGAAFCKKCGAQVGTPKSTTTNTSISGQASGGGKDWFPLNLRSGIAVVGVGVGALTMFISPFIALLILCGVFAYGVTQGLKFSLNMLLLCAAIAVILIGGDFQVAGLGLMTAASIVWIISLKPESKSFWPVSLILIVFTSVLAYIMSQSLFFVFIIAGLLIITVIQKSSFSKNVKIGVSIAGLLPLIILGFIWIASGALSQWNYIADQALGSLSGGLGGSTSSSVFDQILNPKLAVQAQLKPATTREISETGSNPTIAFSASGNSFPTTGCYDTSTFQVTGKITNNGNEYIKDVTLKMEPKKLSAAETTNNPCSLITLTKPEGGACTYSSNQIPTGVTINKNCIIDNVTEPDIIGETGEDILGGLTGEEDFEVIAPSHTCFIDIIAETGYHNSARLPIQFINNTYAETKFQQRQLIQSIQPSTSSVGPVELSLGGFEQPVIMYGGSQDVTLMTTISNTGNGKVNKYLSAYLFIPNTLLKDGQCAHESDSWTCYKPSCTGVVTETCVNTFMTGLCSSKTGSILTQCTNFKSFASASSLIDVYKQFDYDQAHKLLLDDYSICFYKEDIDPESLITTGKCTLRIGNIMGADKNALRKTLIIRGDVLYTYQVKGQASFAVRDCTV